MLRLALSIAAAAALLCLEMPPAPAQYYGDAPWRAVVAQTDGEMTWMCEYGSAEDCAPHVTAGNRGFCNRNPYPSRESAAAAARKHHMRRN